MSKRLIVIYLLLVIAYLPVSISNNLNAQEEIQLTYKPAPVDNPLKGLVPYWKQQGPFPCSMEFWYFPVKEIMKGPAEFDWQCVEEKLEDIRSRGNQTVLRMYLEYPGKESGMPDFLLKLGVKLNKYRNDDGVNLTPDYHDPRLIKAMEDFVAAFGKKYDRDPRVGYITMGILGHWGEWHTYPKEKLFASKENQTRIQNSFAQAFKTTKILMRYPAGNGDWAHAPNHEHPVGYHDDSFAWATLDTGNDSDNWFFEPAMKAAGAKALEKWKTQPIGGEIRPEIWGCVFDPKSCAPQGQEFEKCVQRLHATWLMDSGMFAYANPKPTPQRIAEASKQVRKMGYELFVQSASIKRRGDTLSLSLSIQNTGVAPFYYDWPIELVALDDDRRQILAKKTNWKLSMILPENPIRWNAVIELPGKSDQATLAIRVINPMPGGKPLRFANESQSQDGLLLIE